MAQPKRSSSAKASVSAARKTAANKHRSELTENPALYRAKLNCMLGRDAINGKTEAPSGTTPTEYALFCLLHAVEDIANAMFAINRLGQTKPAMPDSKAKNSGKS